MFRQGVFLKVVRWSAVAALGLAIIGFVYEQVAGRRDRRAFPQIGRSVSVGGRSLNLYCSGDGSPAVVFDSGGGMPGYSWLLVQPAVAKLTRACWYDRAGYGWSDPAPASHGSDAIAKDLHALLRVGGVAAPYVLVGHSFGGFNVRMYYHLYAADVAGLVLVDPSHEDMRQIPNPAGVGRPLVRLPERLVPVALFAARLFGSLGLVRLLSPADGLPPRGISRDQWATLSALRRRYTSHAVNESSGQANIALMRGTGGLRDLPLIVLTAGKSPTKADSSEVREYERARIALLGELARTSTSGRQIVVSDSGHMIPYEAPQRVIDAVLEVVIEAQHPRLAR
jgi:pimeloyl-ACP methyl ester carboxylesterase